MRRILSVLSFVAAMVLIVAILSSAKAGDADWCVVWAVGLGVLGVGRAVELLIEEKVKS